MLVVAARMIQKMVRWSSLTPQLAQQPTTAAIVDIFSAMETVLALVKLMESGLGAHPLVNVSEHVKIYLNITMPFGLYGYILTLHTGLI